MPQSCPGKVSDTGKKSKWEILEKMIIPHGTVPETQQMSDLDLVRMKNVVYAAGCKTPSLTRYWSDQCCFDELFASSSSEDKLAMIFQIREAVLRDVAEQAGLENAFSLPIGQLAASLRLKFDDKLVSADIIALEAVYGAIIGDSQETQKKQEVHL